MGTATVFICSAILVGKSNRNPDRVPESEWAKGIPCSRQKCWFVDPVPVSERQKPHPGTSPYSRYMGVPPPPGDWSHEWSSSSCTSAGHASFSLLFNPSCAVGSHGVNNLMRVSYFSQRPVENCALSWQKKLSQLRSASYQKKRDSQNLY